MGRVTASSASLRGNQAGDALPHGIAESLRSVLRSEDIPVRTGGDELVVLLPNADRTEVVKAAHRIRQCIAAAPDRGSRGVSSGTAVRRRGTDPDDALGQADEELYGAKAARARSPSG
jgi:diguanylate cyclase (GGDEF)-like protein